MPVRNQAEYDSSGKAFSVSTKDDRRRFDTIVEVEKFNPYHGPDGRFTTASGATSFTIRTRAGYQQGMADRSIQRAKDKHKKESEKPKGTYREGAKFSDEFKLDSLRHWGKSGYDEIRKGKDEKSKKMADALEEAINEHPSVKGTIYRGINTKEELKLKKGAEIDMGGLSSFTSDRSVADDFSRYGGTGGGKYKYVFRAQNVSGSMDMAGSGYASLPHEKEVLVSGKSSFKVKKITKDKKNGQIIVDIEEQASAKKSLFSIMKSSDDKRLVFGWASIAIEDGKQLEDMQHDIIDPEDLEEAAYEYVLKFRDTGEEHMADFRKKGKLVESCVFTEDKQKAMGLAPGTLPVGWWIGFYIEDDDAWERIKNGTYRMFSIEGKAERVPADGENVAKGHGFDKIIEIDKFNPYHGPDGRFTSAGNATSFTIRTRAGYNQGMANRSIERAKDKHKKESVPAMTEDEYLGRQGLRAPISDFMDDKLRNPHGLTARQSKQLQREADQARNEYNAKRDKAKAEYREKIKNGEIRDKTNVERLIDSAHGNEDNESTHAARRALARRGIDWKTTTRKSIDYIDDTPS